MTTETTETLLETDAAPPEAAAEAPNEMAEQVAAAEATDPNVLGKMDEDENQRVTQYKLQAQALIQEIGRLDIRCTRMQRQVDDVSAQKAKALAMLEQTETEAQKYLDAIGARFEIKAGEPWQALPDGTVRRVDPELLRAAQAAAQAGPTPPQ